MSQTEQWIQLGFAESQHCFLETNKHKNLLILRCPILFKMQTKWSTKDRPWLHINFLLIIDSLICLVHGCQNTCDTWKYLHTYNAKTINTLFFSCQFKSFSIYCTCTDSIYNHIMFMFLSSVTCRLAPFYSVRVFHSFYDNWKFIRHVN